MESRIKKLNIDNLRANKKLNKAYNTIRLAEKVMERKQNDLSAKHQWQEQQNRLLEE